MSVACSQSAVSLVKQTAGELVMIDRVKVKRQRQFIVPTTSRIGLVINPLSSKTESIHDEALLSIFTDEGLYTFSHFFSMATLMDITEQKPSSLDFIIRASLLGAVTHSPNKQVGDTQILSDEKQETSKDSNKVDKKHTALFSRIRPYHALIKLELLDANTRRLLDIAIVKSRSGTLGSLKFNGLIKQSFSAYSKSITSTHSSTF